MTPASWAGSAGASSASGWTDSARIRLDSNAGRVVIGKQLGGYSIQKAKRLLDHVVDHAPEAYRRSVQENVPLHRDIAKAWGEHRGD